MVFATVLLFCLLAISSASMAAEYVVSPSGDSAGLGTAESPWSLEQANASAQPGDTVLLLDGVYRGTPIAPAQSGKPGRPITYRAARKWEACLTESLALPGPRPDNDSEGPAAIFLQNRSHIVIDGLAVKDPGGRFLYAGQASHITVQGCRFENTEYPRAWESCRFKQVGDRIVFRGNTVRKGNDSLAITGGSFHLIEGNTFEGASHTCLVLMGVTRSVVRGNRFTNPIQKLMEVFTGRRRDFGETIQTSEHLVIEDNFFGPAPLVVNNGTGSGSGSSGIQYAGCDSILRRNVYFKCGLGIDFTSYTCGTDEDPEALYCQHNRFYHNTVYDCGWPAVYASGPGVYLAGGRPNVNDNVLVNNVLYRNHAHPDAHFPPDTPHDVQIAFADPSSFVLRGNLLMGEAPGAIVLWDKREDKGFTLGAFEQQFPDTAGENHEGEPEFCDAESRDFRLRSGSPALDAGLPLTATRSSGSGSVVEIEDARYFTNGYGVVEPDIIRVGEQRVTVLDVDFALHRITVDRPIVWKQGDPVTLDYVGQGPDIGAFEFGAD